MVHFMNGKITLCHGNDELEQPMPVTLGVTHLMIQMSPTLMHLGGMLAAGSVEPSAAPLMARLWLSVLQPITALERVVVLE